MFCFVTQFTKNNIYNFSRQALVRRLSLKNCRFLTHSSHFFANNMKILHKTEVQTVTLRCWTGLYLNQFKSYDKKRKYFPLRVFPFCKKLFFCNVFCVFCIFYICVITFEPIKIQTRSALQNDCLNLVVDKKWLEMAVKRTFRLVANFGNPPICII